MALKLVLLLVNLQLLTVIVQGCRDYQCAPPPDCPRGQVLATPSDASGCPMCPRCQKPPCPLPVCPICLPKYEMANVIRCDGCQVCECCPILDKCPFCPTGYIKESNGCPTCQCQVDNRLECPPEGVICPLTSTASCELLCGTDGHDYCNVCLLRAKNCRDHTGVTVAHLGSCNCSAHICPRRFCEVLPPCPTGQVLVTPRDAQDCPLCPYCKGCPQIRCAQPRQCPPGQELVTPHDEQGCPLCPVCKACPQYYCILPPLPCPKCQELVTPHDAQGCPLCPVCKDCPRLPCPALPPCPIGQVLVTPLNAQGCPQCPMCKDCPKYPCVWPLPCPKGQIRVTPVDLNGCPMCAVCKPIQPGVCPVVECFLQCLKNFVLKDVVRSDGCTVCECCPILNICPICPFGYVDDANGCPTCKCKKAPCPLPVCPICAPGYTMTNVIRSDGCLVCECCPILHVCPFCPFGYVTDKKGCPTCQCKKDICPQPSCTLPCKPNYAMTDVVLSNGCHVCRCCPILGPCPRCPFGYLTDSNGCPTCKCKGCPDYHCKPQLPICTKGQVLVTPKDAKGCPMCPRCERPPCPPPTCTKLCMINYELTNVIRCDGCHVCECCPILGKCPPCPTGYVKDTNGCPTCQCQVVNSGCPPPPISVICPLPIICETLCGTDGHDYCSTCLLRAKNCRDHTSVTVAHLGSCDCSTVTPSHICPEISCKLPPPCLNGQILVTPYDANGCPLCPVCADCKQYACRLQAACPPGQQLVTPQDPQTSCPMCPICTVCPQLRCISPLPCLIGTQFVTPHDAQGCPLCPICKACTRYSCAPPPKCPYGQYLMTPLDAYGCHMCPICKHCPPYYCPNIPKGCPVGMQIVTPKDTQGCPMCPECGIPSA